MDAECGHLLLWDSLVFMPFKVQENAHRHHQGPPLACGPLFSCCGMWKLLAKNPAKACLFVNPPKVAMLPGWGRRAGQNGLASSRDFGCTALPVLFKKLLFKNLIPECAFLFLSWVPLVSTLPLPIIWQSHLWALLWSAFKITIGLIER